MEGTIVGDEPCPSCREQGRDSTGNHLMIFEDGNKYCNRCNYFEGADGSMKEHERQDQVSMNLIANLPMKALEARGIRKEVAEYYGVRTEINEENGEDKAYYYPLTINKEVVGYRRRTLPKSFMNVSHTSLKGAKLDLFGQYVVPEGRKYLLITGGQDDMLAAFQMLVDS